MIKKEVCKTALLMTLHKAIQIHEHSMDTVRHSDRIATVAHLIGLKYGLSDSHLETLWRCALLHDLGKIGIDSYLLTSKEKLNFYEREIVNRHPVYGSDILKQSHLFAFEAVVVYQHHENFDGTGYPDRLLGKKSLLYARIIHICDVYDALVTFRGYKELWTKEQAQEFLYVQSEKMFDPDLVPIFLEISESERFLSLYSSIGG